MGSRIGFDPLTTSGTFTHLHKNIITSLHSQFTLTSFTIHHTFGPLRTTTPSSWYNDKLSPTLVMPHILLGLPSCLNEFHHKLSAISRGSNRSMIIPQISLYSYPHSFLLNSQIFVNKQHYMASNSSKCTKHHHSLHELSSWFSHFY